MRSNIKSIIVGIRVGVVAITVGRRSLYSRASSIMVSRRDTSSNGSISKPVDSIK